jgi:hypothetical protein
MLRSRQIMLSFLHCSCQLLGDPQRVTEDLSKKIFVGGLSPSVESGKPYQILFTLQCLATVLHLL